MPVKIKRNGCDAPFGISVSANASHGLRRTNEDKRREGRHGTLSGPPGLRGYTRGAIMRPDEPKSFDPHTPIDPDNAEYVERVADALAVSPREVRQAVEKVGGNPTAVTIYLS